MPSSWWPSPARLLPVNPARYDGPLLSFWLAIVWLCVVTVRSCIHLFSADGGAQSIATIDVAVDGGSNIVAMFGQWGAIQLLLALLLWVLLLRWRGTVPLVLLVFTLEPVLRGLAGTLKPITTMGTAPGAALNWFTLPVMAFFLYLSLCPARR
ncbi:hypothetical protein [Reyranella sp.]|uniref:hypothetical protein n=1 Tax=Reyranella sp. TaxID=1929291 RepID=UPI0040370166